MQVGAASKLDYGELERGAILDQREDDCSGPIGRAEQCTRLETDRFGGQLPMHTAPTLTRILFPFSPVRSPGVMIEC
jgi:hypothetical protein